MSASDYALFLSGYLVRFLMLLFKVLWSYNGYSGVRDPRHVMNN